MAEVTETELKLHEERARNNEMIAEILLETGETLRALSVRLKRIADVQKNLAQQTLELVETSRKALSS